MRIRRPIGMTLTHTVDVLDFYDTGSRRGWKADTLSQPLLLDLLMYCDKWREHTQVRKYIQDHGLNREDADNAVEHALEKGMLVTDEDRVHKYLGTKGESFSDHNWHDPFVFHWHTNLYPKLDYYSDPRDEKDQAIMRRYLADEAPPPNYKDHINVSSIPLKRGNAIPQRDINAVLSDAYPKIEDQCRLPIDVDVFSWLTYLSYGQTYVRNMQLTGKHVAKTSPSGGSRHPTEIYPVILSVEGLDAGLYHYSVKNHSLELLLPGDHLEFLKDHVIIHKDRPSFSLSVVYIYTTIFERSMHRYRDSRSYRVIHHDIGHLMQSTAYLTNAIGAQYYGGYSLHDTQVDRFLGIDGILESSMAYAAIGINHTY